ncbi:hypothetical protein AVEN_211025-1 [Araneus ventricosus]|uniref:Uncharacterized protein n=1 Tax=Araneus ventricosus TaxID=182803 RepID=A0A4Y2TK90_ARAVE|nr:hypothetical protein AVEN_211025-1 [Araneus ventricosus]
MHGGSSVESGFESGTFRPESRDLTTKPPLPSEIKRFHFPLLTRHFAIRIKTTHKPHQREDSLPKTNLRRFMSTYTASLLWNRASSKKYRDTETETVPQILLGK